MALPVQGAVGHNLVSVFITLQVIDTKLILGFLLEGGSASGSESTDRAFSKASRDLSLQFGSSLVLHNFVAQHCMDRHLQTHSDMIQARSISITCLRDALLVLFALGVSKGTAQEACEPPVGYNWLPQTAHSYNDLDTWSQLIKHGVRSIKLDVAVCTRESCEGYSTWDASLHSSDCFEASYNAANETFCCICLRGDASNRPFLNSPFNTSDDLTRWVSSPFAAAALGGRPTPLLLELDFAEGFGFSYNLYTSPAAGMFLRWIRQFSTAVKSTGASLLPLGGGMWLLPADQAVLAGTATEQDKLLHALPWLLQHGAGAWVAPQADPYNRTRVFNEDWTMLWGEHSICQRSEGVFRTKGAEPTARLSSAPLPPPAIAQLYPLKWYEPSSQLGYRSIAKLLGACTALPPALRLINNGGDGLGVASSSVVSNQSPAMFETLASVTPLGRGLNQLWEILPVPSAPHSSTQGGTQHLRAPLHTRRDSSVLDYSKAKLQALPPGAVKALLASNASQALSTVVLAALQSVNFTQDGSIRVIATVYRRHAVPDVGDVLADVWLPPPQPQQGTAMGDSLAGFRTVLLLGRSPGDPLAPPLLISTTGGWLAAVSVQRADATRQQVVMSSTQIGRVNATAAAGRPARVLDATAVCAPSPSVSCLVFAALAPVASEGLFLATYNVSSAFLTSSLRASPSGGDAPLHPTPQLQTSTRVQQAYNITNATLTVFSKGSQHNGSLELALVFESRDPPAKGLHIPPIDLDVDDEIAKAADRRPKLFFVGGDVQCRPSSRGLLACRFSLDALSDPPIRSGFGSEPDVQALAADSPGGEALLLESHTDGQCQAGLIINNADTSRCVLPRPSSDGDWRYILLQSVRDLLNYNFGTAAAFRDAALAGKEEPWSMCSRRIVSGKFESGRSVAAALYADQQGLVQGIWMHDGRITEPVATEVICGSSDHKPGFVWDQFLLPQPNCVEL